MNNNKWFKLALISLVGIIAAYALLWLGSTIIPGQAALLPGNPNQQYNPGYQQQFPGNGSYQTGNPYFGQQYHNQFHGQYPGQMMSNYPGMGVMGGANMQGGMGMGMH